MGEHDSAPTPQRLQGRSVEFAVAEHIDDLVKAGPGTFYGPKGAGVVDLETVWGHRHLG